VDQQVPAQGQGDGPAAAKTRNPDEIQADIEAARTRLIGNLDQLKARTNPKNVASDASRKVKGVFVDASGELRRERIAAAAGGVLMLLLARRGFAARKERKQLEQLAQVVWVPVPRRSVNPEYADLARNAKELAPLAADYAPLAITAG
jgi:hypothetical protein